MRDDMFWVKSCLGKKTYYTEEQAIKGCKEINKRFDNKSRVYLCPHCCQYHLTTKPQENKSKHKIKLNKWYFFKEKQPPENSKIKIQDSNFRICNVFCKNGQYIKSSTGENINNIISWALVSKEIL